MNTQPIWLSAANVQLVFSLLAQNGGEARIVGGAVRDHLMGLPSGDIDFCSTHTPQQVIGLAQKNSIRYIETGVEYGTVTLVIGDQVFEVTSLREDVKTDGRYAEVRYGTSFQQDALRRDFTINALYMAADGEMFDPLGSGLKDLKNKNIRFIGQPRKRIEEDYLRILRYFRFIATLNLSIDFNDCQEIAPLVPGLSQISAERIYAELKRTFAGSYLHNAMPLMSETRIFETIFGVPAKQYHASYFKNSTLSYKNIWLIRFLLSFPDIDIKLLSRQLKISNKEQKLIKNMSRLPSIFDEDATELSKNIYRFGADIVCDNLLYFAAVNSLNQDVLTAKLNFVETFDIPAFPVKGQDLLDLGYKAGPEIGQILTQLETAWLKENFEPDKASLLATI